MSIIVHRYTFPQYTTKPQMHTVLPKKYIYTHTQVWKYAKLSITLLNPAYTHTWVLVFIIFNQTDFHIRYLQIQNDPYAIK